MNVSSLMTSLWRGSVRREVFVYIDPRDKERDKILWIIDWDGGKKLEVVNKKHSEPWLVLLNGLNTKESLV